MASDRNIDDQDSTLDPEDVNSTPRSSPSRPARDPNDEVPVPIAMTAAEIDERAQVVESLRAETPNPAEDESRLEP